MGTTLKQVHNTHTGFLAMKWGLRYHVFSTGKWGLITHSFSAPKWGLYSHSYCTVK